MRLYHCLNMEAQSFNTLKIPYWAAFCLLLTISCSTQKDALLNKWYHQLNTKYNALFYAEEHLKKGVQKILSLHEDDYRQLISIKKHGDLKNAQSAQASLDQAIEKSTMAIKKHSMDIDGDEKNKLIDKAYFIIGQAKFYKQEYVPAINTFNFIIRESNNIELQSEAALWVALCYKELNNEELLMAAVQFLEDEYYLTREQDVVLFQIKTEQAIIENDFKKANQHLLKAIKYSKNTKEKTRMYYLLGQIQLLNNDFINANKSFHEVVRGNPEYEMVFNAKLNQAKTYNKNQDSDEINFSELKKILTKMLGDKKNIEYLDQVYFAIAGLELEHTDTVSAITSLQKSTKSSVNNTSQNIESHYLLSKLFWQKKNYTNAYNHCDSAYKLITGTHPNYQEVKDMLRASKQVADLYIIINNGDSLINLARLPESERNNVIDNYIAELKQRENLTNQNKNNRNNNTPFNSYEYNKQSQNSLNITSAGGWYFYNPSAISLGYSEFLSRWGNRQLEDNWRRQNKNQSFVIDEISGDTLSRAPTDSEKYNREYYVSQLPLTEEEQLLILSKIETAYYDLAGVFKSELQDYNQAVELYQKLTNRFPSTDYRQLVYFDLYSIFNLQNDTIEAQLILNKIEQEFPNGNYLNVINGNQPINDKIEVDKKIYQRAHSLYTVFSKESCEELGQIVDSNSNSLFIAELEMLNAFCQAQTSTKSDFIKNLTEIRTKYEESLISKKADTLIAILTGNLNLTPDSIYTNTFDAPHYFILVLTEIDINLPQTQLAVSTFNTTNYKLDSLQTTNLLLDKKTQILQVSEFPNKTKALVYYELIQETKPTETLLLSGGITPLVISKENFKKLLKEKNIKPYMDYFNKIYLLN